MINMNRRRFLQTTAATAGAITAPPVWAAEHALVIDAHLHCFAGKKDLRFPYLVNSEQLVLQSSLHSA